MIVAIEVHVWSIFMQQKFYRIVYKKKKISWNKRFHQWMEYDIEWCDDILFLILFKFIQNFTILFL